MNEHHTSQEIAMAWSRNTEFARPDADERDRREPLDRHRHPAPTGGVVVTLTSSNMTVATVPESVTVTGGNKSVSFTVESATEVKKKTG